MGPERDDLKLRQDNIAKIAKEAVSCDTSKDYASAIKLYIRTNEEIDALLRATYSISDSAGTENVGLDDSSIKLYKSYYERYRRRIELLQQKLNTTELRNDHKIPGQGTEYGNIIAINGNKDIANSKVSDNKNNSGESNVDILRKRFENEIYEAFGCLLFNNEECSYNTLYRSKIFAVAKLIGSLNELLGDTNVDVDAVLAKFSPSEKICSTACAIGLTSMTPYGGFITPNVFIPAAIWYLFGVKQQVQFSLIQKFQKLTLISSASDALSAVVLGEIYNNKLKQNDGNTGLSQDNTKECDDEREPLTFVLPDKNYTMENAMQLLNDSILNCNRRFQKPSKDTIISFTNIDQTSEIKREEVIDNKKEDVQESDNESNNNSIDCNKENCIDDNNNDSYENLFTSATITGVAEKEAKDYSTGKDLVENDGVNELNYNDNDVYLSGKSSLTLTTTMAANEKAEKKEKQKKEKKEKKKKKGALASPEQHGEQSSVSISESDINSNSDFYMQQLQQQKLSEIMGKFEQNFQYANQKQQIIDDKLYSLYSSIFSFATLKIKNITGKNQVLTDIITFSNNLKRIIMETNSKMILMTKQAPFTAAQATTTSITRFSSKKSASAQIMASSLNPTTTIKKNTKHTTAQFLIYEAVNKTRQDWIFALATEFDQFFKAYNYNEVILGKNGKWQTWKKSLKYKLTPFTFYPTKNVTLGNKNILDQNENKISVPLYSIKIQPSVFKAQFGSEKETQEDEQQLTLEEQADNDSNVVKYMINSSMLAESILILYFVHLIGKNRWWGLIVDAQILIFNDIANRMYLQDYSGAIIEINQTLRQMFSRTK